jgi:two-component system, OmpR family, phosphate regulon sensor histidine kinase PhoR
MLKIHIVIRIAMCFLFVFLPLRNMDEWFYDRFFRVRGPQRHPPSSLVLVRVNNANLSQSVERENFPDLTFETVSLLKSSNLWHARFYQPLLDRIERDKPRLVIFTTFFEGVDDPKHTSMPFDNVIFSAILNEESKLVPPPPHLTVEENYGFSNIFPDSDHIVRSAHLVYSSGSSLALAAHRRLSLGPINRNLLDPLWIDYRGPSGSFPLYEARDVLEQPPTPGTFSDKIVLIGRESGHYSEFETPMGRMTKMEIQANILDTFFNRREIRILPRWFTLLCAAGAVMLSIGIILYLPLTVAWLFLLLQSLALVLLALLSLSFFKVWAGIANPIFCIFATHLLMLGYKLSRHEEEQWKIQQEAAYLKELDQFKNNFISLFSHDLKTPIAKIKAVTNRLLTEHPKLEPDVKESLKSIDRTNNELARFITDILKLTKMESMSLEPNKEVIDLNRLVEQAVQRLKFLADEKNITIVLDLEPLFSMEGDQQLILEVITNLVENAIKYSPTHRRIVVQTGEENQEVRVSIIDEGEGIPADEIPRVTGKFYRGREASQKAKGSGLGLYLSKYFVELHRGRLAIQSEIGKGTNVSFWLPLAN